MLTSSEEARALRAGEPLPAERIIARRAAGIHAIRRECIIRMLQSGVKAGTLDIAWDDTEETTLSEKVTGVEHKLTLWGRRRVVGKFPDLWRVCYPDDEELKAEVDNEIERMVDQARKNSMEDLRKG